MFGFKKSSSPSNGLPDALNKFLEVADEEYIKAFSTKTPSILKQHFTRRCCMAIGRWSAVEGTLRYFPDKKFRTTTWKLLSYKDDTYLLQKDCCYRDVKINIAQRMKLSDDYSEKWVVLEDSSNYMVDSIEEIR